MAYIVAICGGSGAGKTTLSNKLKEIFKDDLVQLPYDSYCKDQSSLTIEERAKVNYDLPSSYDSDLFAEHVKTLKNNESINKPIFDFPTHTRKKETELIKPSKIIIIEGIMVFQVKEIENDIDLKIYVEADTDIRLGRRILRDIVERGRKVESIIHQYIETVKPSFEQFIEPKKLTSDIVFDNNKNDGLDKKEVEKVVNKIKQAL